MDRTAACPILFWRFAVALTINNSFVIRERVSICGDKPYRDDRAFCCEYIFFLFFIMPEVIDGNGNVKR
ncbi:hypothetical protein BATMR_13870 [Bacillus altitudinis]|nr:hypothetical protein BATMR_13870 [Bacillus altitudinis]